MMKNYRMLLTLACLGVISASQAEDKSIPGYRLGDKTLEKSPVSLEDFELLKKTVLFSEDDVAALQKSKEILEPKTDEILDVWYGFVGSNPHLVYYFSNAETKEPNGEYLAGVRKRFGKWISDTAAAEYDQDWLNYQHLIAIRHHRSGKNKADNAEGAVEHIPLRYVTALHYAVTATLKPFLEEEGVSEEEVNAMHQAWIKSVLMQVILWSEPYTNRGDF